MFGDLLTTLWNNLPAALLLSRAVIVPLSFTVHEVAHALVGTLLGDPTPRESGRLTLNPLRHVESLGVITGVLIGVGWSRPTPIRPHRMRLCDPVGGLLTVLAGPLSNLGLALAGQAAFDALALQPTYPWSGWPVPADFLTVLVRFNLTLALLNALPLFPLDGYALIRFALPLRAAAWWERASGWTTAVLGVALFLMLMLPPTLLVMVLGPPVRWGIKALLGW